MDGKITYSFIINLNAPAAFVIHAYPNPVQNNLTLYFSNALKGNYAIRITDLQGQKDSFP